MWLNFFGWEIRSTRLKIQVTWKTDCMMMSANTTTSECCKSNKGAKWNMPHAPQNSLTGCKCRYSSHFTNRKWHGGELWVEDRKILGEIFNCGTFITTFLLLIGIALLVHVATHMPELPINVRICMQGEFVQWIHACAVLLACCGGCVRCSNRWQHPICWEHEPLHLPPPRFWCIAHFQNESQAVACTGFLKDELNVLIDNLNLWRNVWCPWPCWQDCKGWCNFHGGGLLILLCFNKVCIRGSNNKIEWWQWAQLWFNDWSQD